MAMPNDSRPDLSHLEQSALEASKYREYVYAMPESNAKMIILELFERIEELEAELGRERKTFLDYRRNFSILVDQYGKLNQENRDLEAKLSKCKEALTPFIRNDIALKYVSGCHWSSEEKSKETEEKINRETKIALMEMSNSGRMHR